MIAGVLQHVGGAMGTIQHCVFTEESLFLLCVKFPVRTQRRQFFRPGKGNLR